MKTPLKGGHAIRVLENGEEYFPSVFNAIRGARHEVLVETFILFEDKVGRALHTVLVEVARRGVRVELAIDGYGSPDLSAEFYASLAQAGVCVHVFDPRPKWLGMRTNIFRRLHRKLVAIDGAIAFCGGINYSADHLSDWGPDAKQDYAVEIHGPIAADIREFLDAAFKGRRPTLLAWWAKRRRDAVQQEARHGARIAFVTRDNDGSPTDIERQYRVAIRAAQREVIIANAYFFPGWRLLHDLRRAARRNVRVTLILQGQPDMPVVRWAAKMLYDDLLRAGVRIYEYCERPLHGKVACIDDEWATVGSSNLDPLSLALNLEANVFVRDRAFNQELRSRLDRLIQHHCRDIGIDWVPRHKLWRATLGWLVFHFVRRYPAWAGYLPGHRSRFASMVAEGMAAVEQATGPFSRAPTRSKAPTSTDQSHHEIA
ncbi:MAG TPA: cardiolipin synthase ClsB [Burkholderiaceae bacterium]|nr:cardiolipin synthase ClsB [Burkholderiaceae bacterium]